MDLKYVMWIVMFFVVVVQANNFRDGMKAYRQGNYDKAKVLFEIALKKDKVYTASHMLGKMYFEGKGVSQDLVTAIKYFKFAHKYGNMTAGCYASLAYMENGVVDWGILEDGLARGLKHKTAFCYKVVDKWQNQ